MKRVICAILISVLLYLPVNAVGTSAKAAAVINADTLEVIYAHNADSRLPMASTTKIMTALLLCENADLEKEITVTADMLRVEGSSMGLLPGDRVTFHDLLYGLLLASGNDAANVTAISLAGSVEKFAELMNKKAKELGLQNTNFVTPSGLDAEGHYTTAKDLAILAAYALKNQLFAKAAGTQKAVLNYGNPPYRRSLTNHNRLLKTYEGAIGVKTGFTKKSGRCLVSAATRDGKTVVAVTLNDPNDWADHEFLLDYGLDSIKQSSYSPAVSHYRIPVIGGEADGIDIFIDPFTVNTLELETVSSEIRLPKFVYAPIKKGDILGSIEYYLGNQRLGEVQLSALVNIPAKQIKPSPIFMIRENFKYILRCI